MEEYKLNICYRRAACSVPAMWGATRSDNINWQPYKTLHKRNQREIAVSVCDMLLTLRIEYNLGGWSLSEEFFVMVKQ